MKTSRGYRNNNPLNIRRNDTKWQGLREKQTDSAFFQFKEIAYGYRAAIKILRIYQSKYGLKTLREMINRWAPPMENDTAVYIYTVCTRSNIRHDVPIDLYDKDIVCRILEAMAFVENGSAGNYSDIEKGFELL